MEAPKKGGGRCSVSSKELPSLVAGKQRRESRVNKMHRKHRERKREPTRMREKEELKKGETGKILTNSPFPACARRTFPAFSPLGETGAVKNIAFDFWSGAQRANPTRQGNFDQADRFEGKRGRLRDAQWCTGHISRDAKSRKKCQI